MPPRGSSARHTLSKRVVKPIVVALHCSVFDLFLIEEPIVLHLLCYLLHIGNKA